LEIYLTALIFFVCFSKVHLNFLLFLHRLAEEARINAFENKSKTIKSEHTMAAAKVILKKSRG
uniref:Centromere protein W n=1 Tax=Pelusios castaneus TaxID=367368 RepID=A0A8C8RI39_9SAUR